MQSERVKVLVSSPPDIFEVPYDLLASYSRDFKQLRDTLNDSCDEIILPDVTKHTFENFFIWLHTYEPDIEVSYPCFEELGDRFICRKETIWNDGPYDETFLLRHTPTFPAKEAIEDSNSYSQYEKVSPKTPQRAANPDPGWLEIIWNSSASHSSHKHLGFPSFKESLQTVLTIDELRKGWDGEWGNFLPLYFHARFDKLLDRDYVLFVTQTMVSFENLALWAKYSLLIYKVYPGFWGRCFQYYSSPHNL